MAKRGAKNKYETLVKPYLKEINKKIRSGVTEYEIAKSLGISMASLSNYKRQYPELMEALSRDKGKDILQQLINAGIQAAIGYYKDEVNIETLKDGSKKEVITRKWYPPNPTLNQFYVKNYGKDEGFVADPLDYELKKAKQELDEAIAKNNNWDMVINPDEEK